MYALEQLRLRELEHIWKFALQLLYEGDSVAAKLTHTRSPSRRTQHCVAVRVYALAT